MKRLLPEIDAYLSHGAWVFPSEIAAEFWRRAVIRRGTRVAVREDRLISWDTFKERAFEIRQEAVPTNRTIRTVFAERFIRENADRPVLHELIPPAFASDALGFTGAIESVLPRIPAALAAMGQPGSGRLSRICDDLRLLKGRYSSFMIDHGLFEPRWMDTSRYFRGGEYQLVAPELVDDFPEFQSALAALPRFNPGVSLDLELTVFADTRSEIRSVLASVARLLDAGTDPEEIYVSVGDLEHLSDRLRQEGEKYQTPLIIRAGRMLSDSAVGRFIRDLGEVVTSGFGVGAVERLVLNRGIPWRDPTQNAALVLRGVAHGAIGGTSGPDPRWSRVGSRNGARRTGGLLDQLRRLLPKITNSSSFRELRSGFNELLSRLVVGTGWAAADERVLERSQDELRNLAAIEQHTGLIVDDPYRFWLDRLGEHPYVPQQSGSGVTVLPYRVGAATYPLHHFVMNATHAATSVVARPFPFLSEADRDELGAKAADRDLSSAFLNAYSVSGESVVFSASRSTFEGTALPAGLFVSSGRTRDVTSEEVARLRAEDSYSAEERFVDEYSPLGLQVLGAAAYVRGASFGGPDFTRNRIDDPDVRNIAVRRVRSRSNPDLLRLSASHIDSFRVCPFGYLLTRGLNLAELTLEVSPDDPIELGKLYHDILAAFFDELARAGTRFRAEDLPALRKQLAAFADALYGECRGMIPGIVYDAHREIFDRVADAILRRDAQLIDGHEALLVEAWQREQESRDGFVLVGRVDRVTRAPDGSITLVDYKKSTLPTKTSVNAGSEVATGLAEITPAERAEQTARLGSVQIPLYVRLLEAGDLRVASAGYFSLEKARYFPVLSDRATIPEKACMNRERLDEVMMLVDDVVASITGRINAGDFTCNDECAGCSMRSVCRTRFHVR
ncbi:MAG: PD-(D/E)XK nuclease family protein [Spirochaetia bacterium]